MTQPLIEKADLEPTVIMNYGDLAGHIETLETAWHKKLPIDNPDARFANGEVQFFAVEKAPQISPHGDLPVVLAIGINYTQNKNCCIWPKPCLGAPGSPAVTISTSTLSPMLREIECAFKAYSSDPMGWVNRCLASDAKIPVPTGYLLIATNFSPLITFKSWQKYDPQYTAALLTLFSSGFEYLDDLMSLLKKNAIMPEVIVGHGLGSEVPVLFRKWQSERNHRRWLLTPNLARPFPNGPNAFFKRQPPPVQVRKVGDSRDHYTEPPEEPELPQ